MSSWVRHPPSLKSVVFIYFWSPPLEPAETISGPRCRALICASASVFSPHPPPTSYLPLAPSQVPGEPGADVSFWPGYGGSKPALQRSVASGFSSAFPKRRRGKAFPQFSPLPPAACHGHSEGGSKERPGVVQAFYFPSGFHQSKRPVLSNCHLYLW